MSFRGVVIIVSFNSGEYLARSVASITTHAPGARVVVIDNASADGSTQHATLQDPRVELHVNQQNVGFARGVNQGLATVSTEYVLILNPDCYLMPGAVETLEGELARHPECTIAGPQILNDDGSVQGSARGDPTLFTGLFGRSTLFTRLFPRSRLARQNIRTDTDLVRRGESFAVDWVSGACFMARRETLAAVGGFDERYFLYWEDADLCRRLRNAGHTMRYVPTATVVHSGGVSSRGARALATQAFHKSAYTYYATHVARSPIARAVAWVILTLRCRWKLMASRDA